MADFYAQKVSGWRANIVFAYYKPCLFPDHPKKFQTIRKVSRPSRNFPDHPQSFHTIAKVSGPSKNFPDHMKSFQTIWNVSRPSGNLCIFFGRFHSNPQKLSGMGKKNFPGGSAMRHGFFCLWVLGC